MEKATWKTYAYMVDNTEMVVKGTRWEGVDWTHLAQVGSNSGFL
jgi:hypothetical protein